MGKIPGRGGPEATTRHADRGESGQRLPPLRAFVVQFSDGDLGDQPSRGRVEHVRSGRSTRFDGLDRLAEFFAEVLTREGSETDDEDGWCVNAEQCEHDAEGPDGRRAGQPRELRHPAAPVCKGYGERMARAAVRPGSTLPLSLALSLAFIALFPGCAGHDRQIQRDIAAEASALEPSADNDEAVRNLAAEVAAAGLSPTEMEPLADDAGLEEYVRVALRRNPSIRRAIRQAEILGYRVPQVTSLDDPMLTFIPPTGDMVQTAGGMLNGAIGLSQKIPFPGKLGARGRVVEEAARMALAAVADARVGTVAQVQRAYASYYLADVSLQIARESEALLRQIHDVAAARYRAGAATQQDVLRSEVELYTLANETITLEQQRATAVASLNSLMDRRVDAALPAPKPLRLEEIDWKLPQALERASEANPKLARLQAQLKRDLQAIRLAKLEYYPDVTAGFTYSFISPMGVSPVATGSDVWNLSFGLNLPVWWQRLRAHVLESNAQALASVEEYAEMRNLIVFQIQDVLVKIDTQYRQAVLFRDLIVPRAWQTVEVSTSEYRAGVLDFTALIDNWKKWLELSLAYHRSLAGLEEHFADLQQLVGVPLPRVPDPTAPDERGTQGAVATPADQTETSALP
jgi:outer membrane protein, heavy metal efflux system